MKHVALRAILIALIVTATIYVILPPPSHAEKSVQVTYNGGRIDFSESPFISNGNTYIQVRPFAQTLGFRIDWLDRTRLSLTKPGTTIVMEVGRTTAAVNGVKTTISPVPKKVGPTLFVPLRAIAEKMNFAVSWEQAVNTVSITNRTPPNAPPSTPAARSYKVIAYYPSWGLYLQEPLSEQPVSQLTHVNYAFANVSDGQVVLGDPDADLQNFKHLRQLKAANPKLRALISVGGWTWSGQFSDAALTSASRQTFAASAVAFMKQHGFDGVDIDWEYPVQGGLAGNKERPEDKRNFTLLLQEIRQQLDSAEKNDGRDYLLTIAGGAFPGFLNNVEISSIAAAVDWINLMTYDYHGPWDDSSNHNAPLYADSQDPSRANKSNNIDAVVDQYLKNGVPAGKLVLGVPFYGRSWTSCGADNQGLYQDCDGPTRKMYSYEQIMEQGWINANGFVRYWNSEAKVPYLYKKTTGTFVSYEDAESIGYKTSYVKSRGLGGAMIWEITQDDESDTLLNKLAGDLNRS
ncbi:glycosyl hydrolase family 18 protein [Cohnella panacarvi]|uniref:glycosyl hydrolase family 18 protein n=1 Tax=Cohnella panacarvi TaxID=400776 RepID=UPI00047E1419|nr:glycosyl hydrolase family 18 protein [Cohnella panacarvi]